MALHMNRQMLTSASDPTSSDKQPTLVVTKGDLWHNTTDDSVWICLNAGTGVWKEITNLGGEDTTVGTLTANAIAGGDASLGVTGQAAAQGGAVAVVGGTSSTAANAGGAVTATGGTPGATGVGGAATIAAGIGGATSGAGGVASLTGGAGTAGNSAGGVSKTVGGAGQGTAAGGAAQLTGGASGAGATGNGGAATVTGGAAASTNGNGGGANLRPGAGTGTGVPGVAMLGLAAGAGAFGFGCTRSTIANGGTITDAQHRGQVLYQDASGGNVTMTTRTGTQLAAAFADLATGEAIPQFHASNHASNTSTVAGGTDVTLVGSGAITQTGGTFLLIKTAATTFDLVRVG